MPRVIAFNALFFLLPFGIYGAWLLATRGSLGSASDWPIRTIAYLAIGGAVLMVVAILAFIHFDTGPTNACAEAVAAAGLPRTRRAGASTCRQRWWTACSSRAISNWSRSPSRSLPIEPKRRATMTTHPPSLAGADWLRRTGVRRIFAALDRDGDETRDRRRRGPRRARRAAGRRHRLRHHRPPRGRRGARGGGRAEGGADRHRARDADAGRRRRRLPGDDAARGRRDRRAARGRPLRPRLGGRRAPARLHRQRALGRRGRRRPRSARRLSRRRRPPRPLHRRRRRADRRGPAPHPPLLPLQCRVRRRATTIPPGSRPRSGRATASARSRPSGSARRCAG